MMKKLTKGIEESKKEKERLAEEKEKMKTTFKEIEQKAFAVQENYKKTQEVLFWLCIILPIRCNALKKDSAIYLFIVVYKAWLFLLLYSCV